MRLEWPDWDGYITLDEANEWYRHAFGKPLYADFSKVDLSKLKHAGDNHVGEKKVINLHFKSRCLDDKLVYGKITIKWYPNNKVRAYDGKYDFSMQPGFSNIIRNFFTFCGGIVAGKGTEYNIFFYGTKELD